MHLIGMHIHAAPLTTIKSEAKRCQQNAKQKGRGNFLPVTELQPPSCMSVLRGRGLLADVRMRGAETPRKRKGY